MNYLRHNCLTYDKTRDETKGKTGKDAAGYTIKRQCLTMIAERYPEFTEECERQAGEYD